jgi:hypothetical protein
MVVHPEPNHLSEAAAGFLGLEALLPKRHSTSEYTDGG